MHCSLIVENSEKVSSTQNKRIAEFQKEIAARNFQNLHNQREKEEKEERIKKLEAEKTALEKEFGMQKSNMEELVKHHKLSSTSKTEIIDMCTDKPFQFTFFMQVVL